MACSTYDEITAVMDRVYAVAEDQPLAVGQAFASLAQQASPEAAEPLRRPGSEPNP